jgi:hypothetical protein
MTPDERAADLRERISAERTSIDAVFRTLTSPVARADLSPTMQFEALMMPTPSCGIRATAASTQIRPL